MIPRMNWRVKCLAFHAFGVLPWGESIYAMAQKRITGTWYTRLTDERVRAYQRHVDNFKGGTALEIGAGGELLSPLLLSAAGAERVIATDVVRLATVERVNAIIRQLSAFVTGDWPEITSFEDLARRYRIEYRAPSDINYPSDFIYSTSTFEHVPLKEIPLLLAACRAPRMHHIIDYHDHFPGVSRLNYLRYGDTHWRLYNPPWHHQNRLRHCDHRRLFEGAGFKVIKEERLRVETVDALPPLASKFSSYDAADLLTTRGEFLLERHHLPTQPVLPTPVSFT